MDKGDRIPDPANENLLDFSIPGVEPEHFKVFNTTYLLPNPGKLFEFGRNKFLSLQSTDSVLAASFLSRSTQLSESLYPIRDALRKAEDLANQSRAAKARSDASAHHHLRSGAFREERDAQARIHRAMHDFKELYALSQKGS
ncbi:hypothetical protein HY969_02285 [Candidatus Kaiserbacteria bacterium]|nr:hypothetical protein [Candidatus Kaiserbacteria bacterium]